MFLDFSIFDGHLDADAETKSLEKQACTGGPRRNNLFGDTSQKDVECESS